MTKRLMHCTILLTMALWLSTSIAQAQTRSSKNQESDRTAGITGQFRVDLLAQARPKQRAGFALMPSSSYANASGPAFSITPTAAGPNLPVQGGGTPGRLTKWTGFTSSNSFIGDSTIFESKLGLVGIGIDSPTSRLTVAGAIESTTGGFKFPDGTVQTTSAGGALFGVVHDVTLVGNGSLGSPLGVAIPLLLSGSVSGSGVIQATNTADGWGIESTGGPGREGLNANGGDSDSFGGNGVIANGGNSLIAGGGDGMRAFGGRSDSAPGGVGVRASGGSAKTGDGGVGAIVNGGNSDSSGLGGDGVRAFGGFGTDATNTGGIGILARRGPGFDGATDGLAGRFEGDVEVSGNLSKGGGSFKIDHPLDPENRYLYHSFVESPDMMNIYNGNVVTDENGEASVMLPGWFEALNRDFRYQLTVIGTFAQAIVADEIKDNRFVIRTSAPNVKVSWQVTGVRQDAYANKHRIKVEEQKAKQERGYYLHPEAFNQPEDRGVEWARHPELMRQMKERREQAKKHQTGKHR